MDIINIFSSYTLSEFGFSPRKNQIKAAKLLAYKHSLIHMDTGEGKTVVAALAALMSAQDGRHVYVVTVNDYLAKRDMEMFRRLFTSLGYTAMLNTQEGDKKTIHSGDIIYTSVQNLLFDYVSNEFKPDGIRFNLDMAILDEIDYVLLDSANTHFSVSMGDGCCKQDTMLLDAVWHFTNTIPESDFTVELPKKRLMFDDSAYERIEDVFAITPDNPRYKDVLYLCHTALLARYCYFNGIDYLVEPDGVLSILNAYNGRASRNSYYEHELDYFLRKKENIRFAGTSGGRCNTMSAPILFRKFKTVVGMSGTTKQASEELGVLLGRSTSVIRPVKRSKRVDKRIKFKTRREKYVFIEEFIKKHNNDYAYLIICEHEQEAEEVNALLNLHFPADLLVNRYTDIEQELIDNAGHAGNILVSTHLVGRGTDIVSDAKCGLCVFVTHKGADTRVGVQARGRTGRNGDTGLAFTLISDEDNNWLCDAELEAQRVISLCEDIIFESAKLSLMEWAETNSLGMSYVSYWLDFRRSLSGRILQPYSGDFANMVYKACEMVKWELRMLKFDILLNVHINEKDQL